MKTRSSNGERRRVVHTVRHTLTARVDTTGYGSPAKDASVRAFDGLKKCCVCPLPTGARKTSFEPIERTTAKTSRQYGLEEMG
jgi:hypothetical protein